PKVGVIDMLYNSMKLEATAAIPRVVDAHSLLHLQASKAVQACDAADAVDGLIILQNPTQRLAAAAFGVSLASVARALRLPPEERQKVRDGQRPLVLPRALPTPPVPSFTPVPPITLGVERLL